MRALVIEDGPRVVDDHPEPERTAGEALIHTRLAGICDTDIQLQRGYMNFRGVPGHEFVGEVLDADDATWNGKRVVADINAGCGECADCVGGDGHHCASRSVLGILHRNGAFAERFVVPERCLVEVPVDVPDDCAVFAEPIAAAAHVLDDIDVRAAIDSAHKVVVLGDGKLGLLITLVLVNAGADVIAVGHHREKLALAVGAELKFASELHAGWRDAAVVVEATGSAAGFSQALSLVRPRGTIILKTTVADTVSLDLSPVVVDELRVVGSRCGNISRAVEMLATRVVDPRPLVADRYSLHDGVPALRRAQTPGVLKVLIET
jgi:threonine dehydrogenase-like Zn-dependent dehydrogenase